MSNQLRTVTLLFLLDKDRVLLAMKKRGFGEGRFNGVGGKLNSGESIEDAAKRECEEEIGVVPKNIEKVAILNFYFTENGKKGILDQQAHVFLSRDWYGEPVESEEMKPEWFNKDKIPFDQMWPDDILWLPKVLAGSKIDADFYFGKDDAVEDYKINDLS